jgi:hypothetical protein
LPTTTIHNHNHDRLPLEDASFAEHQHVAQEAESPCRSLQLPTQITKTKTHQSNEVINY